MMGQMMHRRHDQHIGIGAYVVMLGETIALFAAFANAAPTSEQMLVNGLNDPSMVAATTNDGNIEERRLQLFPTETADLLCSANSNDCPLCPCFNSTDDADCLLSAATEACASNTFESCLATELTGGFDVRGLCDVQCIKPEGDSPTSYREICRLCEIFTCCDDCAGERVSECFPPSIEEDGYTPPDWKPASCITNGGGTENRKVGVASALFLVIALLDSFP